MREWGRVENRQCWGREGEQQEVPRPVKKWILTDPTWRTKVMKNRKSGNVVYGAIMAV